MIFHSNTDFPPKSLVKISASQGGRQEHLSLVSPGQPREEQSLRSSSLKTSLQSYGQNGAKLFQEALQSLVLCYGLT